jgi:hypothetical protein
MAQDTSVAEHAAQLAGHVQTACQAAKAPLQPFPNGTAERSNSPTN